MSKFILGSAQFGSNYGIKSKGQIKSLDIKKILDTAITNNINSIDTAYSYGNCEKILGNYNISKFKIISKTRHFKSLNLNEIELIKKDFSSSLARLKQENIYAILIHDANDLFKKNGEKLYHQLVNLKQSKKVIKIGVSVYHKKQLEKILENFDIDLVQFPLNIFDRRITNSSIMKKLQNKNIEIHGRSIFLQGLLLFTKKDRPKKFSFWGPLWELWHEWLVVNNISALQASLRYALSIPNVSKLIVGVDNHIQLEEILQASKGILPSIPKQLYTNDDNLLNPSNWEKL